MNKIILVRIGRFWNDLLERLVLIVHCKISLDAHESKLPSYTYTGAINLCMISQLLDRSWPLLKLSAQAELYRFVHICCVFSSRFLQVTAVHFGRDRCWSNMTY